MDSQRLNGNGKKVMEWDLNDWNWNGDLFLATPVNASPPGCGNKRSFPSILTTEVGLSTSTPSCSDETVHHGVNDKERYELEEKRRKVIFVDDDEPVLEVSSLALKLGGIVHPKENEVINGNRIDNKSGKIQTPGGSSRGMCQVEGCGADLIGAKDYHRRHKVCETHAKASKAIVGNAVQRFCQQCSRFHLLQEFDEGKRSCRRRLDGHNKRRRKAHPDVVCTVPENPLTDAWSSSYLLISLLRILSNLQSKNTEPLNDQDLLTHFLKNLASLAGSSDGKNLSSLMQACQDPLKVANSTGFSSVVAEAEAAAAAPSNDVALQESFRPFCFNSRSNPVTEVEEVNNLHKTSTNESINPALITELTGKRSIAKFFPESTINGVQKTQMVKLKSFDLNDAYNVEEEDIEIPEEVVAPRASLLNSHLYMIQESHQSTSPPQTSGNSDSTSVQSFVSSNGDAKGRTDKIIFKLFGKDPKDLSPFIRAQMFNWLSNTPSEIESYIKPGCIILTVYLCLSESYWLELCHNLSSSLKMLLDLDSNGFWRTGWMYVRVRNQMAFIYNGQLLLNSPYLGVSDHFTISRISPIAVSPSKTITFRVNGFGSSLSSARLFCAFEGKYLAQETTSSLVSSNGDVNSLNNGHGYLSFSCSIPDAVGRGFIEIEDESLSSSFFPYIIAEKEICSEICMLEDTLEFDTHTDSTDISSEKLNNRSEALEFLHEMGWLLRRSQLRSRTEEICPGSDTFSIKRFKCVIEFGMKHEWRAVVKKLLDLLFGGVVDLSGCSIQLVLGELALLHFAVQINSQPIVDLLLNYSKNEHKGILFRPDMVAIDTGLTPLHMAASRDDTEAVLDALTDDPGQVGISAWKTIRDITNYTPEDYARAKNHESYLRLVDKKITQKSNSSSTHVIVDIPMSVFDIKKGNTPYCQTCNQQQLKYMRKIQRRSLLIYKPAILSMVGIAAVCVCLGLLLKGLPEVQYVLSPFRWETTRFGPI
ncbi:putative Squamosa promoter-binding protein [Zostera marina]|uniref:Putative Squamosa promoter-binding protein n=1 Tax=Zostera marina TaxID=29655 RepID=A0A0K9NW96_ZOSMR|nr:putative Squamosa promoter-binding protein [Zostera marina]